MSLILTQTDTSVPFDVGCSGVAAGITTLGVEMVEGGTPGAVDISVDPDNLAEAAVAAFSTTGGVGVGTWQAGDYVVRVNFVGGNGTNTWTQTHICEKTDGGAFNTVASLTGQTTDVTNMGVFTHTVNRATDFTPAGTDSDLFIVVVLSNADSHGNSTSAITPDQDIDTPIEVATVNAVSGAVSAQSAATDGASSVTAAVSGAVQAQDSVTDGSVIKPLLLDEFNQTGAVAFSVARKLRGGYSGSAIELRESGGGTLADIGFDADADLDETAFLNHIDVNDGFISNIYDQGTGGKDISEATDSLQPQIGDAGTVIRGSNNRPALDSLGTRRMETAAANIATQPNTIFLVVALNQVSGTESDVVVSADTPGDHQSFFVTDTDKWSIFAGSDIVGATDIDTEWHILDGLYNGANSDLFLDGVEIASGDLGVNDFDGFLRLFENLGQTVILDGKISELIMVDADLGVDRDGFRDNINDYYSVFGADQVSGSVSAQDATASGAVAVELSLSGSVQAQAAATAGNVSVTAAATGDVSAQAATTAGEIDAIAGVSGGVTSQDATAAGAVAVTASASGDVAAAPSTATGAASVTAAVTGAVTAQAATADGSAGVTVAASGGVSAQIATADGAVSTSEAAQVSGAVTAQDSATDGSIAVTAAASGEVGAQAVSADGSASVTAGVSGDVSAQDATADGAVDNSEANQVAGAVAAQDATASGDVGVTVETSGGVAAGEASVSGAIGVIADLAGAVTAQAASVAAAVALTVSLSGAPQSAEASTSGSVSLTEIANAVSGAVSAQGAAADGAAALTVSADGGVAAQDASTTGDIDLTVSLSGAVTADSATVSGSVSEDVDAPIKQKIKVMVKPDKISAKSTTDRIRGIIT